MPHRLLLALVLLGLGCGAAEAPRAPTGVIVAASIPPHAWLIEQIGGDRVTVHCLLRPGESPTTHQPSDAQVSLVLTAEAYFRCGVPFESGPWLSAIAGEVEIIDLRDEVATRRMVHDHSGSGHFGHDTDAVDPHTWLSPARLAIQARSIASVLGRLDPAGADGYATRLDGLRADLDALDARIRRHLAPHRGRSFLVFHPSWGYFADDYGLEQLAIEIEGKEPSDAELTRIQEQARERDVTVVFVQPQIAGRSARAVAQALGARLEILDPLAPDVTANLRLAAEAIAGGFDG